MVLGKAGSGGQLQNMAGEESLMGPLSSEFSRDSPSPSTCPLVVWEVEREVVVVVGQGAWPQGSQRPHPGLVPCSRQRMGRRHCLWEVPWQTSGCLAPPTHPGHLVHSKNRYY